MPDEMLMASERIRSSEDSRYLSSKNKPRLRGSRS